MKAEHIYLLFLLYDSETPLTVDELRRVYKKDKKHIGLPFFPEYRKDSLQIILSNMSDGGLIATTKHKGSHENGFFLSEKGISAVENMLPTKRRRLELFVVLFFGRNIERAVREMCDALSIPCFSSDYKIMRETGGINKKIFRKKGLLLYRTKGQEWPFDVAFFKGYLGVDDLFVLHQNSKKYGMDPDDYLDIRSCEFFGPDDAGWKVSLMEALIRAEIIVNISEKKEEEIVFGGQYKKNNEHN